MNLLRQAVGDPVLNYLGQSHGTGLGAVYAQLTGGSGAVLARGQRQTTRTVASRLAGR